MTEGSPGFHGESQERLEFRAALRSLLDKTWSAQDARAYVDGSTDAFDKVTAALRRDMSLSGILVPEEYGGLGGSYGDAAVAAEELGATLFPHDLLGSWIASDALLNANNDDNTDILKLLASEANAFVFAWPGQDPSWRLSQITTAHLDGEGITGACTFVPGAGADDATVLLPVSTDGHVGLGIVHAAANPDAVTYTPRPTTDLLRPIGDLTFHNAEGIVLNLAQPDELFAHAVAVGAVLLAAEATGAARACLDATVAYGTAREQFGKQLITFQAVKHRVGNALIAIERARASVYRAAAKAEERSYNTLDEFIMLARIAKTSSTAALRLAARESVQLHGAMGFTWENPSHLYLRRWSVTTGLFGKTDEHHEWLYHHTQNGARS